MPRKRTCSAKMQDPAWECSHLCDRTPGHEGKHHCPECKQWWVPKRDYNQNHPFR